MEQNPYDLIKSYASAHQLEITEPQIDRAIPLRYAFLFLKIRSEVALHVAVDAAITDASFEAALRRAKDEDSKTG